ncbi:LLM class flavin-dependent oxidoreductase [Rhodococcus sp. NCIMB 12038]|uniref:LLM class flavin-dependent oxidoreductase n=1 Tax=Rhodococcus sp. NCIMB 12038 TaxID=933800 RepID=UPI000B3BFB11|nr:LLM class flavin-dependent oxidoreductase [Rhodococcus sp. NCIMB 12038]OUS91794.1 FMNH2-dependent monooxygenase [Rhodococcus sp. NCIMB 12038]
MTSNTPLHLAAALDGAGWHPAAWREPNSRPDELFTGAYWTDLAAVAQRGLLDFVTIEDSLAAPVNRHAPDAADSVDRVRARIDAHLVAARIAPVTRHLGLIPTITTTHTEPFHVSKGIATLDYTSRGRAGWQVKVSGHADEAAHFGRRAVPEITAQDWTAIAEGTLPEVLVDQFDEAGDFVEVVRRLWDSWEDGAEIRDVENRRFIDRDTLHYIDFEGRYFSVRGPSTTPRPPQGQPVVTALAHQALPYELAARGADLVFVTPADDVDAQSVLADVAAASEQVGRTGEPLRVYADLVVFLDNDRESGAARLRRLDGLAGIEFASDATVYAGSADDLADHLAAWQQLGFDGFRLRPGVAVDDLETVSSTLVPILQRRGLLRTEYPDTFLRGVLGLPTDVPNRFVTGTPAA